MSEKSPSHSKLPHGLRAARGAGAGRVQDKRVRSHQKRAHEQCVRSRRGRAARDEGRKRVGACGCGLASFPFGGAAYLRNLSSSAPRYRPRCSLRTSIRVYAWPGTKPPAALAGLAPSEIVSCPGVEQQIKKRLASCRSSSSNVGSSSPPKRLYSVGAPVRSVRASKQNLRTRVVRW